MMPSRIFLIGPMGAGKSTIGRQLASKLDYTFCDSDSVIEMRSNLSIAEIFSLQGEAAFRNFEKQIINELTQYSHIILATGGGAVLAEENRQYLYDRGLVVYLKTSVSMQLKRLSKDKKRPLLQTENLPKRLKEIMQYRLPLYEATAHITIPTDEMTQSSIIQAILNQLDQYKKA